MTASGKYPMERILMWCDGPVVYLISHPDGVCLAFALPPGHASAFDAVAVLATGRARDALEADEVDLRTLMTRPETPLFSVAYTYEAHASGKDLMALTRLTQPLSDDFLPEPGCLFSQQLEHPYED